MTKFIALGISFLLGLLVATSVPTSSSEADQLPPTEKSELVSNEMPAIEPAACLCCGS